MKRPVSVVVISILLILNALVGLLIAWAMSASQSTAVASDSISPPVVLTTMDYAVAYLGIAAYLVTGVGLFMRQGWMRFLPIASAAVSLLHGLLSMHITAYVVMRELMFVGIISAFLFSGKANMWFAKINDAQPAN